MLDFKQKKFLSLFSLPVGLICKITFLNIFYVKIYVYHHHCSLIWFELCQVILLQCIIKAAFFQFWEDVGVKWFDLLARTGQSGSYVTLLLNESKQQPPPPSFHVGLRFATGGLDEQSHVYWQTKTLHRCGPRHKHWLLTLTQRQRKV